ARGCHSAPDRRSFGPRDRPAHGYQRIRGLALCRQRHPQAHKSALQRFRSGNVMTDISQPSNAEIEGRAAMLLRRQHFEVWTAQDETHLSEWLSESPRHSAAYWRLKAGWDQTERLAALRAQPFLRSAQSRPGSSSRWVKGIAAAAVISALAAGASFWNVPDGSRYATGVGGRTTIRLADGSELDLGTQTEIRADFSTNRRVVNVLHGEVFFRIAHNASRPFVVTVGRHRVIDVGTEF